MRTTLLTIATALAVLMPAGPVDARTPIPVQRVDKQCRSGHNPNCHRIYVENWVFVATWPGPYPAPGYWIKFK